MFNAFRSPVFDRVEAEDGLALDILQHTQYVVPAGYLEEDGDTTLHSALRLLRGTGKIRFMTHSPPFDYWSIVACTPLTT